MSFIGQLNIEYSNETYSAIGKNLYLSDETADVNFIFEPDVNQIVVIPAHKSHLGAASEAFRTIFIRYAERIPEGKCQIRIIDATPAAFKEFLKFFYFTEVKISAENSTEVMRLVEKFGIDKNLKTIEKHYHGYRRFY